MTVDWSVTNLKKKMKSTFTRFSIKKFSIGSFRGILTGFFSQLQVNVKKTEPKKQTKLNLVTIQPV